MRKILITSLFAGLALWSCTPEEKPSGDAGFDVSLEIPAEIVLETNAKSIEFNVVDGKAPKSSDLIILDGPAGQKFCKIQSASSSKVKVELYSGVKEGDHKVSVQRNLDVKYLGTTKISYKVFDDGVHAESGSSVYGRVSRALSFLMDMTLPLPIRTVSTSSHQRRSMDMYLSLFQEDTRFQPTESSLSSSNTSARVPAWQKEQTSN